MTEVNAASGQPGKRKPTLLLISERLASRRAIGDVLVCIHRDLKRLTLLRPKLTPTFEATYGSPFIVSDDPGGVMKSSNRKLAIAEHAAQHLAGIPGVVAVALGGSLARGRAQANSDIDLGIYYYPAHSPSIAALRDAAAKLDDSGVGDAVTGFGGWGPWVNGGAWLTVEGQRLDWIYRDLDKVERVFAACAQGEFTRNFQPGHPHGFPSHIYLGEMHYNLPLFDLGGSLADLKKRVDPFPEQLAQALIETYGWQAYTALGASEKSVERAESSYVAGCFFESAYCLIQVLFALNRRFFVNEKGALSETQTFELVVPDFADIVQDVLSCPGTSPQALKQNWQRLWGLADAVGKLASSQRAGKHL